MRNWYKSSTSRMALAAGLAVVALATSQSALAGPTGGQVAAGQATIAGQGSNAVLVTQSTDRAIITVCDHRLVTMRYGRAILAGLPPFPVLRS